MPVADTSFVIDVLAGHRAAIEKLRGLVSAAEPLLLPAPVLHELYYGMAIGGGRQGELARVAEIERSAAVLPLDASAARLAGTIEAELESRGKKAGRVDVQIAAIALHHGERVLTRDRRFPKPTGLVLDRY